MTDKFKNMYFSCDSLDIVDVGDLLLFKDFDCDLKKIRSLRDEVTFSPVRLWVPSLTFPNVPSPIVLPRRD